MFHLHNWYKSVNSIKERKSDIYRLCRGKIENYNLTYLVSLPYDETMLVDDNLNVFNKTELCSKNS